MVIPFLFIGCSNDDEVPEKNIFKGTKWTAIDDFAEFFYGKTCTTSIEFLTENACQQIDVRKGMTFGSGTFVKEGTYTCKGDSVFWTIEDEAFVGKATGSILVSNIRTMGGDNLTYTKE